MHRLKTIPATAAGSLALFLLAGVSGCGRNDQAAQAPSANAGSATAAASSAQASASAAEGSALQARANVPAAGTVANAAGDNQKTPPPALSVAEQHQGANDEAPQELRDKVAAARTAGAAPARASKP